MQPKRVLHVVGNMGAGGMETLIMNWYRKIDREKLQFDFLVHKPQKAFYEDEIKSLGGNVYHMTVLKDWNFWKYKKELKEFFANHKEYKIVHGHHSSLGAIYLKEAKNAGVPCRISHSHIASCSKSVRGYIKYLIAHRFGKFANVHFACSKVAGEYMYGNNVDFSVVNNGIDTQKFSFSETMRNSKRKELGIENKLVLVHVGRFFDQKNHTFLIDIFNEIKKINQDSVLLLVGTGPLEGSIKEKVHRLSMDDDVKFLGVRSDVEDILSASDVFVFPSLYEGLPLTLVEAQASGLPVICSTNVTDETKLTEHYYSLSLDETPKCWAMKIIEVLKPDANREMASAIVKKQKYDCNDVVDNMQKFYAEQMK